MLLFCDIDGVAGLAAGIRIGKVNFLGIHAGEDLGQFLDKGLIGSII